jgi:hypothetical protein
MDFSTSLFKRPVESTHMRKKPFLVHATALTLVLAPLYLLAIGLFQYHLPLPSITDSIGLQIAALTAGCWISAIGIWKVRAWGYYLFLALASVSLIVDLYAFSQNRLVTVWLGVDLAMCGLGIMLFLRKNLAEPYFNPQIRWWDRAKRVQTDYPVVVGDSHKQVVTKLLDLSETGCFVETVQDKMVGAKLEVDLTIGSYRFVTDAVIIRFCETPKGVGLRFDHQTPKSRKAVKHVIKQLEMASEVVDATASNF